MQKTREYQVLFEGCNDAGCTLCRAIQQSTRRYLEAWKYELFTDVELRSNLRKSQGFCHTHTWELARIGASLPLAQSYLEIISDAREQLQNTGSPSGSANLLGRLFAPPEPRRASAPCPACLQRQKAEQRYLDTLRKAILLDEFYAHFTASSGLCLDHFAQACTGNTNPESLAQLKKGQLVCLQRLEVELHELIRKHDYRFKAEERGTEMLSWRWAAGIVAGLEQLP